MLSDALATIGLQRPGKRSIKERRERIGADLLSSNRLLFCQQRPIDAMGRLLGWNAPASIPRRDPLA